MAVIPKWAQKDILSLLPADITYELTTADEGKTYALVDLEFD